jgi:hypothetical protein
MSEPITNTFAALTNKPLASFAITQSAALATVLAWVGVITPLLGFIAGVFGVVYGYYSMRMAFKKWKDANRIKKILPKK